MKNFKQVKTFENKLEKIFCNMCGHEIPKNKFGYFDDYLSIDKIWSYDSKFDGLNHSFDICQDCIEKLICEMKIKP